jgi:hypothetical protein
VTRIVQGIGASISRVNPGASARQARPWLDPPEDGVPATVPLKATDSHFSRSFLENPLNQPAVRPAPRVPIAKEERGR